MTPWDRRQNNFDFLRLALAVLVIYSHAYPLGLGSEVLEPFHRLSHGQVTGGAIAVNSFFIMSGFLIAASAQRSLSVWSFLKKRLSRIYPAFLVASVLSICVLVPVSHAHFQAVSISGRALDFVFQTARLTEFHYVDAFPSNPDPGPINGSVWSISYEFWCYLGVAMLLVVGLLKHRASIAAIFAASWIIGIAFRVEGWILGGKLLGAIVGPPQLWARLLPLYLAGVVFYLYRDRIPLRHSFAGVSAAALVIACCFQAGWSTVFPIAGAYLLFWFAFNPAIRLHQAGRFGDFSYGTYLYAFPIEQLLVQHFATPTRPILLFLAATPLTLMAAVASWYGVERHFLQPSRCKETIVHAVLDPLPEPPGA